MSQEEYFIAQPFDPSMQGFWTDYPLSQDFLTGWGLGQYPSIASNNFPSTPQYTQSAAGPISLDYDVARKTGGNKQKAARAAQACEQCRYRKQKCDEGSPCAFCRENAIPCNYRSVTPNRIERALESFHASIVSQSETLTKLTRKMEHLETLLGKQERDAQGKDSGPAWPLASQRMDYWNTASTHDGTGLIAAPGVLSWPSIRQLFVTAGATLNEGSIWHLEARMARPSPTNDVAGSAHSLSPPDLDIYISSAQSTSASSTKENSASLHLLSQSDKQDPVPLTPDSGTRLINGYLTHIGNQHPFLNADRLKRLVQQFIQANGPQYVSIAPKPSDGHAVKRQRPNPGPRTNEDPQTDRSAEIALVMLCCALGEVVLHDRLHYSTPSPGMDTHDRIQKPGTQYFDSAARLIGHFIDGHELIHAQVFLLAGLYKAFNLRMREAASWYSMAGQIFTHLVHQRGLLEERLPENLSALASEQAEDDLVLRAAWTCVQLESEIIPELRLPCSRLSDLAQAMRVPSSWVTKDDFPQQGWGGQHAAETTSSLYTAQVTLRKIHLQILARLYSPKPLESSPEDLNDTIKILASTLQHWRSQLPALLQWADHSHAPSSTPLAELRSTYWETKLLLLRPFLDYTLHILPAASSNLDFPLALQARSSTAIETHLVRAVHYKWCSSGETEVLRLAQLGLEAARHSLAAFDGLPERLLLTNIQSVAHVHFTNVLVLIAARRSRCLGHLVEEREVGHVSAKTMAVLGDLAGKSALAGVEREVLEVVVGKRGSG